MNASTRPARDVQLRAGQQFDQALGGRNIAGGNRRGHRFMLGELPRD